jgi:hypothetical protein
MKLNVSSGGRKHDVRDYVRKFELVAVDDGEAALLATLYKRLLKGGIGEGVAQLLLVRVPAAESKSGDAKP